MAEINDKLKDVIDSQSKELDSIYVQVRKGIQDGVWLGMKNGARKGWRKGLKECLLKHQSKLKWNLNQ